MPKDVRVKVLQRCRDAMLQSKEAYEPIYFGLDKEEHPVMSPGLVFGIDLLMAVEKEPSLHDYYEIEAWVDTMLKNAICGRLPFKSILLIINHGLSALLATALARTGSSGTGWLSRPLSEVVIQFWSISRFGRVDGFPKGVVATYRKNWRLKSLSAHQVALEQCLIQKVLQTEDQSFNAQKDRPQFMVRVRSLLSLVDSKRRLKLLQMLCKYSPSLGFDLTCWPPSKKEQELMPFWHLDILNKLLLPDSKSLFGRSLCIHKCEDFLPSSSSLKVPSWEKQCLVWVSWESLDPKGTGFRITRNAIYELKQKSVRAREPPERRRWTEQAIKLAARTSSVEIFADIVEWSKRYIRDPLVFPDLMCEIIDSSGGLLSCRVDLNGVTIPVSKSVLLQEAQTGHKILEDILQACLLLLREPWARPSIPRITRRVPGMLSRIVGGRMNVVRKLPCGDSVTDSEVFEILVQPMSSILLEYERQGNMEGQTDVDWSGPSGMAVSYYLPNTPNPREMAFIDRLAKTRDELWQQHRVRNDPNVLELSAGCPRGLPIQSLVHSKDFVNSAMKHQEYAPFISSRANQVLFGAADTVMAALKDEEKDLIDGFVDDLDFVIRAFLQDGDISRDALRLWEHYSGLLQPHPDYLGLFQDWLVTRMLYIGDMAEAINVIRPPLKPPSQIRPTVSRVPTGSEIIEWDLTRAIIPCLPKQSMMRKRLGSQSPTEYPAQFSTAGWGGSIPSKAPLVERKTQSEPQRLSIWSSKNCTLAADTQDLSRCVQDPVVLAALLFLDTYTKSPRILRTKFPNVEFPRYTPIYLADEFITFHRPRNKRRAAEALQMPIDALRESTKRIPPQVVRELLWSFLDTLKAEPNAPNYSSLLFHTFDLIEILLQTDKPQLAIDVVIRVWQDFANESSLHRKISLVKLGRVLTPEQGREMMSGFTRYVCEALQAQQQQPAKEEKKEKKAFIKVTTAKMLAQAQAEADFLSQSDRMEMLQMMFNSAHHIDIRREIAAALLELVSTCDDSNAEPYKSLCHDSLLGRTAQRAGHNYRSGMGDSRDWARGPAPLCCSSF
ncbi:hypothetical protein BJX68DRAFT_265117 [Aspergillus pseudodeflectus]|uniref:Uncharacterized protein n=1 Tax=Aspergillus pseudodeflectus TaxID=176178 RepID=A0ABR4KN11_9EURO